MNKITLGTKMFELEKAIKQWLKKLRGNKALEDGYIAELESHLRDLIDEKRFEGMSDEEAFNYAYKKLGDADSIGNEYAKVNSKHILTNKIFRNPILIPALWLNYLKIAVRGIKRNKGYSVINISGLSIGIAVCLLILLYVRAEYSYDHFNKNADRIYRLERQFIDASGEVRGSFATLAPSFTPLLKKDFSQISEIARVFYARNTKVKLNNKNFIEKNVFFAERNIFKIFTIPMITGNPETALKEPFTIVVSESAAHKYFGDVNPVGKDVELLNNRYKITGIFKDTPYFSHIHFGMIASYLSLKGLGGSYNIKEDYFLGNDNFSDNVCLTYALLKKNADVEKIQKDVPAFLDNHLHSAVSDDGRVTKASKWTNIYFRKLTDIHLHSRNTAEVEPAGDAGYVSLFAVVAVFILLIACVNFINLSTAKASKRAKEIGLRKVVGADRKLLVMQFLGESLLLSFIAMIAAIYLVSTALPYFSSFAGTKIEFGMITDFYGVLLIICVFLLTGILAGMYPAFYLTAFKPSTILRGEFTKGTKGLALRKVLVVFQFAISAVLIIGVIVIYKQMSFLRGADLGFNKENVLLIPIDRSVRLQWQDVKRNLLRGSGIVSATVSKRAPSDQLLDAPGFEAEVNGRKVKSSFNMAHNRVGYDFFKTYGMKIIAGRDFSISHPTDDSLAYIINETACRRLGWNNPQKSIGSVFKANGYAEGKIIGVVKNFNYESLHKKILPIVTYISHSSVNTAAIRIADGNIQSSINYIKKIFKTYEPGTEINYFFLDDRLDAQYKNEEEMMELFVYFSILAIFVASLGLLGLSAFTAEQKYKEIAVRKVHGASSGNIMLLMSKQFVKWVITANVFALPVVYIWMKGWLSNFAYRISIDPAIFIWGLFITVGVAAATVSFQTVKAARSNPAKYLRSE